MFSILTITVILVREKNSLAQIVQLVEDIRAGLVFLYLLCPSSHFWDLSTLLVKMHEEVVYLTPLLSSSSETYLGQNYKTWNPLLGWMITSVHSTNWILKNGRIFEHLCLHWWKRNIPWPNVAGWPKKHIQHQTDEISIVSLVKCSQSIGGVEAMPDIPGQAQEQNKQLRCGKGVF